MRAASQIVHRFHVASRQIFHRQYFSSFSVVTEEDFKCFSQILEDQPGSVFTKESDPDILEYASTDWTKHYISSTPLVLRPSSVKQVSEVLRYCNERKIPVVPQGGKTGLVGGGVPSTGQEVVLQLQRMNQIIEVDSSNQDNELMGIIRCEAGCILQDLQEYAASKRGLLVPLDLGAKGTCQIGGNLATNAGGQYFYRYKNLAANVLGLQVVLADGRIMDWNFKNCNFKDNTGYKMHQLFLGSEGTLGVITGVAMACPTLLSSRQAAFVACKTYADVLKVLKIAKEQLGEVLAAMEWMDSSVLQLCEKAGIYNLPLSNKTGHFLLVETHGSNANHDQEKMEQFLTSTMEAGFVSDGIVAQDLQQVEDFWAVREGCNPSIAQLGYVYKYDVSLPISQFEDFVRHMQSERLDQLAVGSVVNGNWGHVLDGNIHYNVVSIGESEVQPEVLRCIEPFLFEEVTRRGGSISAEHGLGQSKTMYLSTVHVSDQLEMMKSMKAFLDPKGILNPGKIVAASV